MTLDIKMKSYEELQYEIVNINTDRYLKAREIEQKQQEIERLNNIINELSDFVIKIYKKEMNKTSDWWLQEELCTSFDDINLVTNFRLEKELKENK